jgi:hypothetical protein
MTRRRLDMLSVTCLCLVLSGLAGAQPATMDAPPLPPLQYDWLKMSSGEWVKGNIDLMRDRELQFDSDEFDDLVVDWADIAELHAAQVLTFVLEDGTHISGRAIMRDGVLNIAAPDETREIDAPRVLAIIEGHPNELNFWSARVTANLLSRSGNTEQTDFNTMINLRREATTTRLDLLYKGNYSKLDGQKSVENQRGNAKFDMFLSRRFFVTPASVELFTDRFQNVKLRSTLGAGLGYYPARDGAVDWYLNVGGGYQNSRYNSVQEGAANPEKNGFVHLGTTVETDLTDTVELDFDYSLQHTLGSDRNTFHHLYLLLTFDLIGDIIEFTTSITWDHVTNPKTNADGITPDKDDLMMAYGLGIDF